MDELSRQLFAVALAATWCGFGLYGLARMAARSPQGREMLARLRRSGPLGEAAALAMLVAVVAIGGTKPGGGNGGGLRAGNPVLPAPPPEPAFGLVEVRTEGVVLRAEPTNSVEAAAWRLRGASEDGIWIERDEPFFALGTNPVRRVYASASGALSFGSARHPQPGAALPQRLGGDASPHLETALAPFRAPLGILPAANETNAAPSRLWHAPAPGGGLIVAWENVLVDRLPGRRATIQAELKPSGDFTYRYDFADALDPPATNFVIGAQAGTNAVNALAILGTNLLAETVWRVDGARVTNGVSVADLLCTNGALRTPARFALEWRNTSGLDPNADSDGDGLPDWDEVFVHGTDPRRADTDGDSLSDSSEVLAGADPLDADENNDGVPDGAAPAAWAADPLWGEAAGATNLVLSLDASVPSDQAATLLLGDLAIPLRTARSWALHIPEGPVTPFELLTMNGAAVSLSLSEPPTGATDPIHLDDPDGVFGVPSPVPLRSAPPREPSPGGSGHLCVFDVRFANYDTGEPAPENECIHDSSGVRRLTCQFSDPVHEGMTPTWSSPALSTVPGWIELCVSTQPGDTDTATMSFESPTLVCGSKTITASIHRCMGGVIAWCHACGMFHDAYEEGVCPHANDCPAKTDETASCTCIVPAVRVSDELHGFWHDLGYYYPQAAPCCCDLDIGLSKARLRFKSGNLVVADTNRVYEVGDDLPGAAWVSATDISDSEPSEVVYDIIHFHSDGNGGTTEEIARTETNRLWAISISFEPITTSTNANGFVNPCTIVCGRDATFELSILPEAFPESRIKWSAAPLNRTGFPTGNIGRQLSVRAGNLPASFIRLHADIEGYYGPDPECWFDVVSETSVQVHALIVGDGSRFAYRPSDIPNLLSGANRIWSQAGVRFEFGSVSFVTNPAWLTHVSQSNHWPTVEQMCNYTNNTGGLELYIVDDLSGVNGLYTPGGLVIRSAAQADTVSHEFGHAMGLKDIYAASRDDGSSPVSGVVAKDRLPLDWGTDASEAYYPEGMLQTNLLHRLIMIGTESPENRVLPYGRIQGVWYPDGYNAPLSTNTAPVGFSSITTRNPSSQ